MIVEYPVDRRPARITVRDAAGVTYLDAEPTGLSPFAHGVPLPLGSFTLTADRDGGDGTHLDFAMTSLDADQPPVRLVLR